MTTATSRARLALSLLLAAACASAPDEAPPTRAEKGALPHPDEATRGLAAFPGLVPLFWDEAGGRVLLAPPLDHPLLLVVSLTHGLGSNDVGLDRGQLGPQRLVEFRRVGPRVLLVAPNTRWRSSSPSELERRAVAESFAEGVLAGFELTAADADGSVLVDATDWLLEDAHGIARTLEDTGQGAFHLDRGRSAIVPGSLRGLPKNSELDSLLTFVSERPGSEVRATAAVPDAPTFLVRHAFVDLPPTGDPGFRPRRFHPGSGYFPLVWNDLTAPLDEELEQRVIHRHRLSADHPIVYYIDRAAPEPVRTALLEGARTWEEAFARAGLPGAFRAELLPADADPHDVRLNVVQWVHRSTRGWSYGSEIADPRTGEILKGHVTLGALRVRRDILLLEGLLSPWEPGAVPRRDPRVLEAALARIRQLSAHEIGHTLGLAHNFAASHAGRASVMDYPPPRLVPAPDGGLDLSAAYAPGCGPWDVLAVRYGYGTFEDEEAGLAAVIAEMRAQGLPYLTDADARGADRAHPLANLWDDGADPLEALRTVYEVRRRALARLSERAVRPGRALYALEEALVPTYLHHRYQLEACVRSVGGRSYAYDVVGEGPATPVEPVAADVQRGALALALEALEPAFLALPDALRRGLPPPPPGYDRTRESLQPDALLFDERAAAEAGIALVLELLLDPVRLARVHDQATHDPGELGLDELLDALAERAWPGSLEPAPARALREELQTQLLDRWIALAGGDAPERVKARVFAHLADLAPRVGADASDAALRSQLDRLRRFLEDPRPGVSAVPSVRVPPGSPIGAGALFDPSCGWGREPAPSGEGR